MASGSPPQRSRLAEALADCCARGGVAPRDLARLMIADGFPAHPYSQHPAHSQENEDWLTDQIQALQVATIATPIVFDQVDVFILYVASSLPTVLNARQLLSRAWRNDEWTRLTQP